MYDQFRHRFGDGGPMRRAVTVSVILHALAFAALGAAVVVHRPAVKPPDYEVQLVQLTNIQEPEEVVETVVKEPEPEPEREPEPEPEPKPERKPEPKPVPKPEPEPERKPEPKPERKPEPKPEPKPVPKPEPEPERKPEPKPERKPEPKPEPKAKSGISVQQEMPSVLLWWSRQVQRKVDRLWEEPGGIRLDAEDNQAVVSFWVNRAGRLLSDPEVIKHASEKAVGESGVRAIKLAAPFPPLPEAFEDTEQEVVITFTVGKD